LHRPPRVVSPSALATTALALAALVLLAPAPAPARAQADPAARAMNGPMAPFRIVGNVYYVGASDVTSFLIATPAGHILLDCGFAETAPRIAANVLRLGFKLADVKVLLVSHAHYDHVGGLSELKRWTGASLAASAADALLLAHGGHGDFHFGDSLTFSPVQADRILRDGDTVSLGGTVMTAHRTPGHTPGNTTWTTTATENGKTYAVAFMGSMSVNPGVVLLGNPSYPGIAGDYARSFQVMKALPCEVFLAPHGSFFDLQGKAKRLAARESPNPFVDPAGCRAYLAQMEAAYEAQLRREKRAALP
jgi:metallo-beta-lactamase class B